MWYEKEMEKYEMTKFNTDEDFIFEKALEIHLKLVDDLEKAGADNKDISATITKVCAFNLGMALVLADNNPILKQMMFQFVDGVANDPKLIDIVNKAKKDDK